MREERDKSESESESVPCLSWSVYLKYFFKIVSFCLIVPFLFDIFRMGLSPVVPIFTV